jgi:alkylation response protein AidB-like acyl-CoA dehydrogenase
MDLTLSEEQRLLRESVDRFISQSYDADHRRRIASDPLGFSPDIWKQFAALGWLALPIEEAYGGLGGGAIETGILMEAFGRGLVAEPYLATIVIGAALVSECGNEPQKQAMLPKVADGSLLLAFAHSERQARFDLANVETVATKTAEGWRLDGKKTAVLDGHAANQIIVSARVSNDHGAPAKLCLFLVPSDAGGVNLRDFPRLGGGRACNLVLSDVRLSADALLGDGEDVLSKIESIVDRALAALGAEAVGIMQIMFDRTLEYTKVRQQFGRPLSANQVIRHRLADMAMQCDEARSSALRAALMAHAEPVERGRAASAHHANRMFALVRTNETPRQQDGISFILMDMKSPGITIRPILTIGGDHEVNQVFFDDVRVPVANRVGEEGKGWTYGKYLLEFERGAGIASAKLRDALRTISDLASSDATGRAIEDPDIAVRMSEIEVDIDTLEMTELRVLSALQTGQNPGAVSSLLKLRVSEIRQAVTRLGVDVIGNDGLAVEPMRPFYKLNQEPAIPEAMLPIVPEYLNGRAYTIFGGSSEIQREIVAKMVLGL